MLRKLSRILKIFLLITTIILASCSSSRKAIPPGTVPEQGEVFGADEQYGHEVLDQLTQTYPLDRNDDRINRVRDIVDRLTKAAHADKNPWHVYVLQGDDVKNAAATRGNYVFVWTGILKTAETDGELATILAHEIGHVLANHTAVDPSEETSRIIAGIAGAATSGVLSSQGLGGPAGDLAELIVRASLEALLVNPDQQSKELEADQIGIFLMADAGYDPQEALNFWNRVKTNPDFSGAPIEFMSSHPSSAARLEKLNGYIADAESRYHQQKGSKSAASKSKKKKSQETTKIIPLPLTIEKGDEIWEVQEPSVSVLESPEKGGTVVDKLKVGSKVKVVGFQDRWLEISEPVKGFVRSRDLAPANR